MVNFIEVQKKKARFTFQVNDTGIGINEEQKERLFKVFSQADSSTTRKFGGSGLGLIISNLLAEKLKSKIEFESTPGKGSSFYFTLETQFEPNLKQENLKIDHVKKVFLIDDNDKTRQILQNYFSSWNVQCMSYSNGLTALKDIERSETNDVIIIDYQMPYLNGLETVRLIRNNLRNPVDRQKIILLYNSSNNFDIHKESRKLGVDAILTKPVKIRELHELLTGFYQDSEPPDSPEQPFMLPDITNPISAPTILIAEDVPMNSMLVISMLEEIIPGVQILEAKNGKEALELTNNTIPDLILMDIQMPEMDGLEATRQFRARELLNNNDHIPIIALTAGVIKEEKEKCILAGMNDFIPKPLENKKLKDVLAKYLPLNLPLKRKKHESEAKSGSLKHFDKATLMDRIENNELLFRRLIDKTKVNIPAYINELQNSIQNEDQDEIRRIAHTLKGISLNMCFPRLLKHAKKLENVAADDQQLLQEYFNQIRKEWQRIADSF